MIDKVVVFTGSKKDFEIFLEKQIPEDSETIPFMELIQHYNPDFDSLHSKKAL